MEKADFLECEKRAWNTRRRFLFYFTEAFKLTYGVLVDVAANELVAFMTLWKIRWQNVTRVRLNERAVVRRETILGKEPEIVCGTYKAIMVQYN